MRLTAAVMGITLLAAEMMQGCRSGRPAGMIKEVSERLGACCPSRKRELLQAWWRIMRSNEVKEVSMGMFDNITGKAQEMFGQTGGKDSGLIKGVMEILSDRQEGGMQGLVESFRQKGLGDIISSWIGTGPNAPISPDQVKEGMGGERLEKVAAKAGVSTDEAATKLSEHLPNVVDKLTPEGTVPEGSMIDRAMDFLKRKS